MSAYSAAVLADGPFRYWKLNETSGTTATDTTANGNATYSGTYTLGVSGEPVGDLAVTLDGSSGIVTAAAGLGMASEHAQTFEILCRRTTITNVAMGLVSAGSGAGLFRWGGTGANQLEFVADNVLVAATSSVTHTDTNWHHVVVTYAGSGGLVSFYFDGRVEGTPANTAHSIAASGTSAAVGYDIANSTSYFNGTLGQAALYYSELSATRVLAHYNAAFGSGSGFFASVGKPGPRVSRRSGAASSGGY